MVVSSLPAIAHAPSLPPCTARPLSPPIVGRGFLVVGAWEELSLLAPPLLRLDWSTEVRAASGLGFGVASLFRALFMPRSAAGRWNEGLGVGREVVPWASDGLGGSRPTTQSIPTGSSAGPAAPHTPRRFCIAARQALLPVQNS